MATQAERLAIIKLTVAMFNAAPGSVYLSELVSFFDASAGTPEARLQSLARALSETGAYKAINPTFQTATEFASVFLTPFNLQNNAEAVAFITSRFATTNKGQIAVEAATAIANSTSDTFAEARNILVNKGLVAEYFSVTKAIAQTSVSQLQSVLTSVTAVASSVDTAKTAIDNGAGGTSNTAFTLTTGIDNLTGTSGSDTFSAQVDTLNAPAATSTFGVSDVINGGAGIDTLNLITTGANGTGGTVVAASVSSVENINVRAILTTAGDVTTVVASNFSGATAFNGNLNTSAVTFSGVATGQSVGITGNGSLSNGDVVAGYGSTVTAATLNVAGGTKAGALSETGGALTSVTVNSTGAANTLTSLGLVSGNTVLTVNATTSLTTGAITATGLVTATVTGAGAVNLSGAALASTVTKVDASTNTGGLTVALGSNVTQAVTGGTGNDVITSGAVLTTGSVNAGDGIDTLDLGTNISHANTVALAAKYTNFETLRVNGTFDASLIGGITAVQLSGATNSITNLSAAQAAAVTGRADVGATTLTLANSAGLSDVLNLTLGTGLTSSAATNAGILTITGFETLNLTNAAGPTSTTGAARTSTITGAIVDSSLTTVTLKGSAFTFTDISSTRALAIDGSALVGDGATTPLGLTVAGNATVGSTITGSAVNDTFTLGTVGSTYNAGGGADTFSGTLTQYRNGTVYNTLDGGAGIDTANITGGAALTMVDDDFKNMSGIERITVASTVAADQSITTGGFFDTNFKAAGVTFTTTTTTGAVTLSAGSFSGAVTVSSTSAAVTGNVSITTGSANDSVTVVVTSVTTGPVVISTGAGNDTIVGGAAASNITGGTGADTMTGGAGVDTYIFANTGDSGTPTATNFDTITNWVSGSDIIDFVGALTLVANATTSASGIAALATTSIATFNAADSTLALRIAAVESAMTKSSAASNAGTAPRALDAVAFNFGPDSYVFVTDGTSGVGSGDTLIKLTGVVGGAITTFTLGGSNVTVLA